MARVKGSGKTTRNIDAIEDASTHGLSSHIQSPMIGNVFVIQNKHGRYAAVKVIAIKVRSRGAEADAAAFDYVINDDGSTSFQRQRLLTHTAR